MHPEGENGKPDSYDFGSIRQPLRAVTVYSRLYKFVKPNFFPFMFVRPNNVTTCTLRVAPAN